VDDFRNAEAGDNCCACGGKYEITKGIEVGHIFKLGTKYSSSMNAMFLDQNGKSNPFVMGCYGIGVTRVVAAAIEQNHDEKGIKWPVDLAPFKICVLPLAMKDKDVVETAENIYRDLTDRGIEVLLDDRDERAGVKFNDAELIGIPLRVVVGKKTLAEGKIELTLRSSGESVEIPVEGCADVLVNKLQELSGK